jgi:hypothetical protein
MWLTRTEGESQHLETKIIVVTKDQASEKASQTRTPVRTHPARLLEPAITTAHR